MVTTLLLIRHGITQSNMSDIYMGRSDEDVSPEGYRQIDKLSMRLKKVPIAAIYSSPLKRTCSSATRIANDHNIKSEILSDLNEIDIGIWQGLSKEKTKQQWPELWNQIMLDPGKITVPQGEAFKDTMGRAIRAFEEIVTANPNKCVAIFTHDIIIKMIVMHVLNAPTRIYHHFQIDCSSVTEITASNKNRKLIELNNTSHLTIPL
jgi:broad specificity phosphatase PhoE